MSEILLWASEAVLWEREESQGGNLVWLVHVGCVWSQTGNLQGPWSHPLRRGFGASPGGAGVAPR